MTEKALLTPTDVDRIRKLLEVIHHARSHQLSYPKACEALGMPKTTFYQWIRAGVLESFLQEELKGMSQLVASTVLDAVPSMLTQQVGIATGKRGTARDATASFLALMKLAGLEDPGALVRAERQSIDDFLDKYRPGTVELHFHAEGPPPGQEQDKEAKPLDLPALPDSDVVEGEIV